MGNPATEFYPPVICNFCRSHLFHMDFPFFSFCISPRQAICILSANLEQSWRTDMISPKMSVCISLQDNITFFTSYHRAHLQHRRKFWRENNTFKPLSQYFCCHSDTSRLKIVLHSKLCDIFCSHEHTETHSYNHKVVQSIFNPTRDSIRQVISRLIFVIKWGWTSSS